MNPKPSYADFWAAAAPWGFPLRLVDDDFYTRFPERHEGNHAIWALERATPPFTESRLARPGPRDGKWPVHAVYVALELALCGGGRPVFDRFFRTMLMDAYTSSNAGTTTCTPMRTARMRISLFLAWYVCIKGLRTDFRYRSWPFTELGREHARCQLSSKLKVRGVRLLR